MAKQSEDLVTGELVGIPPPKKPRGRPSTGKAMSGAERMRRSRERRGLAPLVVDLPLDVLEGIEKYRVGKDITQAQVIERLLRTQLLRPR